MSGNKLTRLHVHADGLIVSKSDTGDDQPVKLTLASAEQEISGGEVVGQIDFKSADDGAAGDGIVCASIQAEALGAFDGATDPTKLSFLTRNSGASTERMVITPQGVGINTQVVHESVDLAIGDSDTGFKTGTVGDQQHLAVITNTAERVRVTNDGLNIGTAVPSSNMKLQIKSDPAVTIDSDNFSSQNGFGQFHIETQTERLDEGGTGVGTSKLKIGIEQSASNVEAKAYLQCVCDNITKGQLLLNPDAGSEGGVGIKTTSVAGNVDLAIGDPDTGLKLQNAGTTAGLAVVTNDVERMRVTNDGIGIGTTTPSNKFHIKSDPGTAINGVANYHLTDGFGQIHIESEQAGLDPDGVEQGTPKLKIGIEQSTVPDTPPTAYLQCVNDSSGSGHLLLNPGGGGNSCVGINTSTVSGSVDLAIGDSDTGIKAVDEGDQTFLAFRTNNEERIRITNEGLGIGTTEVSDFTDLAIGHQYCGLRGTNNGSTLLVNLHSSHHDGNPGGTAQSLTIFDGCLVTTVRNGSGNIDAASGRRILRAFSGLGPPGGDATIPAREDNFQLVWGTTGTDGSTYGNRNVYVYMRLDNNLDHIVGYFENDSQIDAIDFTGQHRSIINNNYELEVLGLIACSNGNLINLDNTLSAKLNEALPQCSLANSDNDKTVYGVISQKEDTSFNRVYGSGFVASFNKTNDNEQRFVINSVGEGGIWVCNKNGAIENGDYVTSSSVVGYGMKQLLNEGLLTNYTVAKLTQDCEFSLTRVVKQKLKVIVSTDAEGNSTSSIDYDANGNVLYEDDLDSEGNQQMVYPLATRFLLADGTQLVDEADYTTRLGNGEEVFIACFVGCTYHCG